MEEGSRGGNEGNQGKESNTVLTLFVFLVLVGATAVRPVRYRSVGALSTRLATSVRHPLWVEHAFAVQRPHLTFGVVVTVDAADYNTTSRGHAKGRTKQARR